MSPNPILLQKKYVRLVESFAKRDQLTLDEALDFFYQSQLYRFIAEGVSDLHCMSDDYLVEELDEEYVRKQRQRI